MSESAEFRVRSEHGHQSLGFRRVIGHRPEWVFAPYPLEEVGGE